MLVLTRRIGERLRIGDDIITVLNISKGQIYIDVNISESLAINLQETVSIRGCVTVKVVKIDKSQVKLEIEAPADVTINREEVYKKDQVGNVLSSNSGVMSHTKG
jgi:carbon storage regulator CsrA